MTRVIGYIDGFNLYYGLRQRRLKQFYWIDPFKLVEALLAPAYDVVGVKYFTARIKGPSDKRQRQTAFLDAVNAVSKAEVVLGKFYCKPAHCNACGATWKTHEEKMTDSAIAAHLVADAFTDGFETAVLVGGDTDIVPAVKMVKRHFPGKQIVSWFPPARKNQAVADVCHDEGAITSIHLSQALMPDEIEVSAGVKVIRPAKWSGTRQPD